MNQRLSGSMKQNLGTILVAGYVRRKLMMMSRHLRAQITFHRLIKHIDTTSASLTCFTPETKGLPMRECEQLFRKVESKDPLEITAELKVLDGTKHVFQLHFSLGCKKVTLNLFLMMSLIKKTRTSCQSARTKELSVAPANIAISENSDPPKARVLQSVPTVSTTKVPEMSTLPKTVEFKSVPRIMMSIDVHVGVWQKISF
ncbi:hypothetical protein Tco_0754864 [Tanacetum coccineum]